VSRPTVLLLHAFPLDSRMWDGTRTRLDAAGWDAVAPDLPWDESARGFAAWADQVLDLVGGDVIPVGISMGGYLSFALWRRAHERIRALVLVDTRASPDTPEAKAARDELVRLVRARGAEAVWERNAPKLFGSSAALDTVAQARRMALAQRPESLVVTLETLRDRDDARPLLVAIDVPVLVVVGEQDQLTPPSDSEALAAALPNARLVRIPGAGHLSPLEQPDVFQRELLAFLETVAE
jgi:3-oxoadipate enol-lactonase